MPPPIPHVDGVEHSEVIVRGLRLHVATAGPASGRPVVLQHGWPQHWYEWRDLMQALGGAGYRAIAPDFRGFGWSEFPPDEDFRKDTLADDVIALCAELGHERVSFVGHDWGCWVGWLLCLRKPQLIERAVMLSVRAPFPPDTIALAALGRLARLAYQIPISAPMPVAAKQATLRLIGAALSRGSDFELDREPYAIPLRQPSVTRASTLLYRSFLTRELPGLIGGRYRGQRIGVPIRFLVGDRDPLYYPEMVEEQAPHFDDYQGESLSGVGHFIPEQVPDLLRERVLGFLGTPAPQGSVFTPR
jgi:pimeloyl-ACP methyl ester carboxylesterase